MRQDRLCRTQELKGDSDIENAAVALGELLQRNGLVTHLETGQTIYGSQSRLEKDFSSVFVLVADYCHRLFSIGLYI